MGTLSRLAASATAAALLVTAVTPASAGWGPPRWRGGYHHDDTGAIIGAVVGIGLIAAIAAAASSKSRDPAPSARYDGPPPPSSDRYDDRYDNPRYDARPEQPRYDEALSGGEEAAVDACAIAARDEGSRRGGFAEVRDIAKVSPAGNGWTVTGTIEQRPSFRASDRLSRGFRCAFDGGRVSSMTLTD